MNDFHHNTLHIGLISLYGRKKLLRILSIMLVVSILAVVTRYDCASLYESINNNANWQIRLVRAAIFIFILILTRYIFTRVSADDLSSIKCKLQNELEQRNIRGSLEKRASEKTGDNVNQIFTDTDNIIGYCARLFHNFLPGIITLMLTFGILCSFHIILGAAVLICFTLPVLYTRFMSRQFDTLYKEYYLALDDLSKIEEKDIIGLETIKMCRLETTLLKDHIRKIKEVNSRNRKAAAREIILTSPPLCFTFITTVVMVGSAGFLLKNGAVTLSDFLTVILLNDMIVDPVMMFEGTARSFYKAKTSWARIEYDCNIISSKLSKQIIQTTAIDFHEIRIENLCFKYNDASEFILRIPHMILKEGNVNLLEGKNGRGKTTLFYILTKTFPNYSGKVSFGDIDLQTINKEEMKQMVSVCPQDTLLFPGSIQDNLLFGDTSMTRDNLFLQNQYLEILGLREEIDALPKGMDTRLYENGKPLSEGQCQRLMILRTLLKTDRKIYLFDEPSSHFSGEKKNGFARILNELSRNHIVVVISHDPALNQQLESRRVLVE